MVVLVINDKFQYYILDRFGFDLEKAVDGWLVGWQLPYIVVVKRFQRQSCDESLNLS